MQKIEPNFKKYFEEIVPFDLAPNEKQVHEYTVEITRATFDAECFEVFKKYEKHVHKKEDKSRNSYERFLC